MSLIDPSTHWWNRSAPRRAAAWLCWTIATAAFFIGGWSMTDDMSASGSIPAWPALFGIGLALNLIGGFLHFLRSDAEDFNPRVVWFPLAGLFAAQGFGDIAHALYAGVAPLVTSIIFAVAGIGVVIIVELVSRILARNRALRDHVERSGVSTYGTVTRSRGYFINHSPVTRVTVKFTDHDGQTRWASQTIGINASVGARVRVRYSPSI